MQCTITVMSFGGRLLSSVTPATAFNDAGSRDSSLTARQRSVVGYRAMSDAATAPRTRGSDARAGRPVHITLIRPPAVSSLHAYSAAIVPPLGPAYIAAALEQAHHEVTAIDALGEAPLQRYPSAHPRLVAQGLTIEEIVARTPRNTESIGLSVMFSQQWPHVAALADLRRRRARDRNVAVAARNLAGGDPVRARRR